MIVSEKMNARTPLGPSGSFLLGSLGDMSRDPLSLLQGAARDYGPVARLRLGPPGWRTFFHLVNHPEGVKHVLQFNYRNYKKSRAYRKLSALVGNGLLTSEGETWVRQRRLAQPSFHRDRLASFIDLMIGATSRALDRWDQRSDPLAPIDVAHEMMRLALDIVASTLFSADLSSKVDVIGESLTYASEHVLHRTRSIADLPIPTERNRRFRRAVDSLNNIVRGVIDERRKGGPHSVDLLWMLMQARDEETGERMDDQQLHDEIMTFLLAGHETTANALAWTWWLLSQNPDCERRLHEEIDAVMGNRPLSGADLPKLRYVRMVFEESLRLYPPAWAVGRRAIKDDVVMGYRIPAGTLVAISPYVLHRHPDYWDEPETFRPERFSPSEVAEREHFTYIPFGAGPRQCIGNHFAMQEGLIALAMIAQRYRLQLVPGHRVELEPHVTLRPKNGLPMILTPRRGESPTYFEGDGAFQKSSASTAE